MKYSKISFFILSLIVLLAGCKTNYHLISVPEPMNNVVYINGKDAKLVDAEWDTWHHLNLSKDTIPGMNTIDAHLFLADKKAEPIIVAVIDSGMDIEHEDLKDIIWTNADEIPNNGIDDDKNGFIDDIHGWNFLGDKLDENLEITRMVKLYEKEFEGKDISNLAGKDVQRYSEYKELEQKVKEKFEKSKSVYYDLSFHESAESLLQNEYNYNIKIYGDGNVMHRKIEEAHSTHVAGIIAGIRGNNVGIEGVASNVRIMSVRVVPEGDEYDKDVAMGIRYAVDNGAKVLNMSFGKSYSPNKDWVGDAIKYAADHDVLILHSAGNSRSNIDIKHTYPNDAPDYKIPVADNLITVGASNPFYNEKIIASYSNYGARSVDVFAPGSKILSTTPEDEYKHFSGTSMATPATAGVAALIRAYYPQLSASQVKHIIMNSGTKINKLVNVPGEKGVQKPFGELSVSGRIVNAYNAVIMADQMMKRK